MERFIALAMAAILFATAAPALAGDKKMIVGFRNASGLVAHEKQDRIHRAGGRIKRTYKHFNIIATQLPEEEVAQLKNDPSVAYVEEDTVISAVEPFQALGTPSQEYLDSWGVFHIGADVAVQSGIKGTGIKVAVLDSGIDYNHPDLLDNYAGGYNFAYDNNDPYDDSMDAYVKTGHGTHVAGIIGARNNGTGVVGVAPEVSLYAIKVLNGGLAGDVSDIIAGIEWAIDNKIQIISMSIGSPTLSLALKDACDKAAQAGIVLVAAAGNYNNPSIEYPAAFDSVIAVTATKPDDTRPLYNYGPELELAAPGVSIRSTVPGGGYGYLTGTSQAAPHVTGVVALLLSTGIQDTNGNGSLVDEIRQQLASTARDLGTPGRDSQFGYGLVDAARALGISPPTPSQPPQFKSTPVTTATEGSPYGYIATATDANGDNITYSLISAPDGMTIDSSSGSTKWTPSYKQAGSYTVTIRAMDSGGLSIDQSYTLTVADARKSRRPVRTAEKLTGVFNVHHGVPQRVRSNDNDGHPKSTSSIPHGKPETSTDIAITQNS